MAPKRKRYPKTKHCLARGHVRACTRWARSTTTTTATVPRVKRPYPRIPQKRLQTQEETPRKEFRYLIWRRQRPRPVSRRNLGRTLEAPIPKMSGFVRKSDLFSKAFISPPCFRAPWNCRSIETPARGTHTPTSNAGACQSRAARNLDSLNAPTSNATCLIRYMFRNLGAHTPTSNATCLMRPRLSSTALLV